MPRESDLQLGNITIDLSELQIRAPAGEVALTRLEGKLLAHLLAHRGRSVAREQLLAQVWGYSSRSVTRAVDNTVSRLRRKIEPDPTHPRWLVSTRGGYRLEADGPVQRGPGNLPAARDSFVGRATELAEIGQRLGRDRLITLTGPGGTGKTRLALEVARRCGGRFAAGTWITDLTAATGREGVLQAVASALHVPLRSGDAASQLGAALAWRGGLLLVLDNCEAVLDAAGELVSAWLDGAPELTVLATSREPLRLRAEIRRPVDPLPLPADNQELDSAAVRRSEAIELFVQRAAAVAPTFAPTDAEVPALARVTRLLDGLPLAIELAAAQVDRFTVHELAEGLQDRLDALTSAERDRPDRHRTLTAALDWSWERLTPAERAVLAQLSVFAGTFDPPAAAAVVSVDGADVHEVLHLLEERSLLSRRLGATGTWRLGLLATVRTWAAEKLSPAAARAAEERHAAHYARFGELDALRGLQRTGGAARQLALNQEIDDILAACWRAIARGDAERAVLLCDAATAVLTLTGPFALASELALAIVALPGLQGGSRARAERNAGVALDRLGRASEARLHHEQALAAARQAGDRRLEGIALGNLGVPCSREGDPDHAERLLEAARSLLREVEDDQNYAWATSNLAHLCQARGELARAQTAQEEALALHRAAGNRRHEGSASMLLGNLHGRQGNLAEAGLHFETALAAARETEDRGSEAVVLGNLAHLAVDLGDQARAIEHLHAALALQRAIGDRRSEGLTRQGLGRVYVEQGALEDALDELRAAVASFRESQVAQWLAEGLTDLGDLQARLGLRADAERSFTEAEAILLQLAFPGHLASLWVRRARALHDWGEIDAARATLARAEQAAGQTESTPESTLGRQLAALRALLKR